MLFQSERLIFRHLVPEDLDDLYALYRDPEIRRYFPDGVRTREETREELEWFLNGHPRHPELGLWATVLKSTGQFVGRSGLLPWEIDGVREIEVAYMVDKRFWRQGLGAEAATAVAKYGVETLGLKRLIALIDPEHDASIKTALRAGLTYEKEIFFDGVISAVYSTGDR
jgi:RimJ/RimL family protein N-acetyltransferase